MLIEEVLVHFLIPCVALCDANSWVGFALPACWWLEGMHNAIHNKALQSTWC